MKIITKYKFLPILLLAACSNPREEKTNKKDQPVLVEIQKVKKNAKTVNSNLIYSGTIEAKNTVSLSFLSSGQIININTEVGQSVRKGQILAELDASNYNSQVQISEADLLLSKDAYTRIQELHRKQSIPESRFIEAKAKLKRAKAQLKINQKKLEDTKLVAPFDGVISKREIELGKLVNPSKDAFEIVQLNEIYAVISIPELEIGKITKGKIAKIFIQSINETVEGKVDIISPVSDPVSRTYKVKIKLTNNGKIREGMIVKVTIDLGIKNNPLATTVVPVKALLNSPSLGNHVFIVNKDNKASAIPIKIERLTEGFAIVKEGLIGDEMLIISGQHKVKEGSPIQL